MERYYSEVLGYITRSVGCLEKAQNIVQEAYTRILSHRKKNQIQDTTQERALFYRAAKNIVIDQYRSNNHADETIDIESVAPVNFEPEAKLASQQQLNLLFHCIDQLPQKTKQAFVLFKLKNLTHQQISKQMGISVSMVEKHLATAMVTCRKSLYKESE